MGPGVVMEETDWTDGTLRNFVARARRHVVRRPPDRVGGCDRARARCCFQNGVVCATAAARRLHHDAHHALHRRRPDRLARLRVPRQVAARVQRDRPLHSVPLVGNVFADKRGAPGAHGFRGKRTLVGQVGGRPPAQTRLPWRPKLAGVQGFARKLSRGAPVRPTRPHDFRGYKILVEE